jgi:hypothetical protein
MSMLSLITTRRTATSFPATGIAAYRAASEKND